MPVPAPEAPSYASSVSISTTPVDSSAVAVWLKEAGVKVRAFSLDFGERSVEREQAEQVARGLEIPLTWVKASGEDVGPAMLDLAWKLDLPFGDAVTGERFSGTGLGSSANTIPVYGYIPAGQAARADSYTDTVLITVYF